MFSKGKNVAKYNIKIECDLESLKEKLSNICYTNDKSYYKLNIYMIPEDVDILEINDLSSLESYAIIQDLNGQNKQIIHKSGTDIKTSSIDNVLAVKELLLKLNYNELMYVNYDIYCYNKDNIHIEVKSILKQGIFIEGNDELLDLLKELNIPYDVSNLHIDNEKIALMNMKEDIKNNMK